MTIRIPGKVILAGEHSVVRGKAALVTPLFSRALELRQGPAEIFDGPFLEPFEKALSKALELLHRSAGPWQFSVKSSIPPRGGLGSSAALSVAIARFLQAPNEFELALSLENLFHGKSSGLDVAAVQAGTPILFKQGKADPVAFAWRPHFYLADTGLRSSTKDCVAQVTALGRTDLDEAMETVVLDMKAALLREGEASALARTLHDAAEIFRAWGLIPAPVAEQMAQLREKGALAVKPTGSGNGGFLLSLWAEAPPAELRLIPVWDPT